MEEFINVDMGWGNEGQPSFIARKAINNLCVELQYQCYLRRELNSHPLDVTAPPQ